MGYYNFLHTLLQFGVFTGDCLSIAYGIIAINTALSVNTKHILYIIFPVLGCKRLCVCLCVLKECQRMQDLISKAKKKDIYVEV